MITFVRLRGLIGVCTYLFFTLFCENKSVSRIHTNHNQSAEMKTYCKINFPGYAAIILLLLLSSCAMAPKSHLGDKAMTEERIELKSTTEQEIWSTGDLSMYYDLFDKTTFFDLNGFVDISTSVTNTFPQADFLSIYVYLLDNEGVATSRHTLRPNISKYNTFPEKVRFSATLPKDRNTAAIAFGYWGNFVSIEAAEGGINRGYEKIEWEIHHNPFR